MRFHWNNLWKRLWCFLAMAVVCRADEVPEPLAKGIQDNSFFVEEAYNQEAGVVQHIFNFLWNVDLLKGPEDRDYGFVFTQEWPVFSQTHQFSYTVPYAFLDTANGSTDGIGDIW